MSVKVGRTHCGYASRKRACRGGPLRAARDGDDNLWDGIENWIPQALAALGGQGELATALQWNCGVYLWQAGKCNTVDKGLNHAQQLIESGAGLQQLESLRGRSAQR